MSTFSEKVREVVRNIPRGETRTYQEIAQEAGSLNASRVVGSILAKNDDSTIPCHRVIRSDGTLGGYNQLRGASKQELLKKEGFLK